MKKTLAVVAGLLAANAVAVAIATRRAERRNPPRGRFVRVMGLRLHVIEAGPADAPAVLLLHGNGAMAQDMVASGLIERLARTHRVICPDRPGFGWSERPRHPLPPEAQAELAADLLRLLGIDRAVVVGHSWGTLVALALALHAPELVTGLVLAAGYYVPTRRLDVWMVSGPAWPGVGLLMRHTLSPLIGAAIAWPFVRRLFAPRPVSPAFRAGFPVAMALRPEQLRATAEESVVMIPAARRLRRRYADIACPVTVLAAAGDRLVEELQAPRLVEALPNATLRIVPGVGHMMHYDPAVADRIAAAAAALAAPSPPFAAGPPLEPDADPEAQPVVGAASA
ncbi:alpha/beta hydrolase [Rhodoplanes sp. TEM]|uniref:Alpha/beta hydrolase n=1 Tax=Rhodoplanes tepidamans TaxID=200616 RepID=A0ABT5J3P1_RHOTP|nr:MULTISPECIES: alpha/beta hydrolase [Rhodoplanes]MDC7784270.1 alpha/beta hydrolase [Rhodoplanes tepidamans]MDC7983662.1 alpha/beta hydrolase [Rhodoplanes sp. TEM]MDQ0353672.1 pimeloyl-ACP methyl ester carboxylesterase [Rhodoplanes tepidamans]